MMTKREGQPLDKPDCSRSYRHSEQNCESCSLVDDANSHARMAIAGKTVRRRLMLNHHLYNGVAVEQRRPAKRPASVPTGC